VSARPDSFLLFFILIPVLFVLVKRYWRGRRDLAAIGGKWRSGLLMDVFFIKWFFSSLFFILFVIFSILALAEFTGSGRITTESSSGIDIVFTVDISGSMQAEDFKPSNRLQAAKKVLADFIKGRKTDRMGLVDKYMGVEGINPLLDKMGGKSWDRVKKKVKKSVAKIASSSIYDSLKLPQG